MIEKSSKKKESTPTTDSSTPSSTSSATSSGSGQASVTSSVSSVSNSSASTSSVQNYSLIKSPVTGKSRISQACDRCRSKKIKCDGNLPQCSNCKKIGFNCKISDKLTRNSFPKGYTKNLEKKLMDLELDKNKLLIEIKELKLKQSITPIDSNSVSNNTNNINDINIDTNNNNTSNILSKDSKVLKNISNSISVKNEESDDLALLDHNMTTENLNTEIVNTLEREIIEKQQLNEEISSNSTTIINQFVKLPSSGRKLNFK
ncbi:hypothetical protein B5S28_g4953 [[Candida] boidinii]|nr:hypothetical protein B5S28_g4953 [[Candida] boidinii]OWB72145.1 hypothetical protein B5S31_g1851 [[Candida] boidinii]